MVENEKKYPPEIQNLIDTGNTQELMSAAIQYAAYGSRGAVVLANAENGQLTPDAVAKIREDMETYEGLSDELWRLGAERLEGGESIQNLLSLNHSAILIMSADNLAEDTPNLSAKEIQDLGILSAIYSRVKFAAETGDSDFASRIEQQLFPPQDQRTEEQTAFLGQIYDLEKFIGTIPDNPEDLVSTVEDFEEREEMRKFFTETKETFGYDGAVFTQASRPTEAELANTPSFQQAAAILFARETGKTWEEAAGENEYDAKTIGEWGIEFMSEEKNQLYEIIMQGVDFWNEDNPDFTLDQKMAFLYASETFDLTRNDFGTFKRAAWNTVTDEANILSAAAAVGSFFTGGGTSAALETGKRGFMTVVREAVKTSVREGATTAMRGATTTLAAVEGAQGFTDGYLGSDNAQEARIQTDLMDREDKSYGSNLVAGGIGAVADYTLGKGLGVILEGGVNAVTKGLNIGQKAPSLKPDAPTDVAPAVVADTVVAAEPPNALDSVTIAPDALPRVDAANIDTKPAVQSAASTMPDFPQNPNAEFMPGRRQQMFAAAAPEGVNRGGTPPKPEAPKADAAPKADGSAAPEGWDKMGQAGKAKQVNAMFLRDADGAYQFMNTLDEVELDSILNDLRAGTLIAFLGRLHTDNAQKANTLVENIADDAVRARVEGHIKAKQQPSPESNAGTRTNPDVTQKSANDTLNDINDKIAKGQDWKSTWSALGDRSAKLDLLNKADDKATTSILGNLDKPEAQDLFANLNSASKQHNFLVAQMVNGKFTQDDVSAFIDSMPDGRQKSLVQKTFDAWHSSQNNTGYKSNSTPPPGGNASGAEAGTPPPGGNASGAGADTPPPGGNASGAGADTPPPGGNASGAEAGTPPPGGTARGAPSTNPAKWKLVDVENITVEDLERIGKKGVLKVKPHVMHALQENGVLDQLAEGMLKQRATRIASFAHFNEPTGSIRQQTDLERYIKHIYDTDKGAVPSWQKIYARAQWRDEQYGFDDNPFNIGSGQQSVENTNAFFREIKFLRAKMEAEVTKEKPIGAVRQEYAKKVLEKLQMQIDQGMSYKEAVDLLIDARVAGLRENMANLLPQRQGGSIPFGFREDFYDEILYPVIKLRPGTKYYQDDQALLNYTKLLPKNLMDPFVGWGIVPTRIGEFFSSKEGGYNPYRQVIMARWAGDAIGMGYRADGSYGFNGMKSLWEAPMNSMNFVGRVLSGNLIRYADQAGHYGNLMRGGLKYPIKALGVATFLTTTNFAQQGIEGLIGTEFAVDGERINISRSFVEDPFNIGDYTLGNVLAIVDPNKTVDFINDDFSPAAFFGGAGSMNPFGSGPDYVSPNFADIVYGSDGNSATKTPSPSQKDHLGIVEGADAGKAAGAAETVTPKAETAAGGAGTGAAAAGGTESGAAGTTATDAEAAEAADAKAKAAAAAAAAAEAAKKKITDATDGASISALPTALQRLMTPDNQENAKSALGAAGEKAGGLWNGFLHIYKNLTNMMGPTWGPIAQVAAPLLVGLMIASRFFKGTLGRVVGTAAIGMAGMYFLDSKTDANAQLAEEQAVTRRQDAASDLTTAPKPEGTSGQGRTTIQKDHGFSYKKALDDLEESSKPGNDKGASLESSMCAQGSMDCVPSRFAELGTPPAKALTVEANNSFNGDAGIQRVAYMPPTDLATTDHGGNGAQYRMSYNGGEPLMYNRSNGYLGAGARSAKEGEIIVTAQIGGAGFGKGADIAGRTFALAAGGDYPAHLPDALALYADHTKPQGHEKTPHNNATAAVGWTVEAPADMTVALAETKAATPSVRAIPFTKLG